MDAGADCYFKVFGMEEGCGGEGQLVGAVQTLSGVDRAAWHSPSHGICVHLLDPSAAGTVTHAVRGLGYQGSDRQANCPCCTA